MSVFLSKNESSLSVLGSFCLSVYSLGHSPNEESKSSPLFLSHSQTSSPLTLRRELSSFTSWGTLILSARNCSCVILTRVGTASLFYPDPEESSFYSLGEIPPTASFPFWLLNIGSADSSHLSRLSPFSTFKCAQMSSDLHYRFSNLQFVEGHLTCHGFGCLLILSTL